MEFEASSSSSFDSSEMLAVFLGSTPLLSEAWRLCSLAYTMVPCGFAFDQVGDVGYVAFSGLQALAGLISRDNALVPVDSELFPVLHGCSEWEDPPLIHEGFLRLFFSVYRNSFFQNQMLSVKEKSKAIIVTGHSIGGAIASLAALWLLSYFQTLSSQFSVLCITFGSPLLGNDSLSKAIIKERWGGKFFHVVSENDIVPRLLFAPVVPIFPQLNCLLEIWLLSMTSLHFDQLSSEETSEVYRFVSSHVVKAIKFHEDSTGSLYRPFGSYLFCSKNGAICLDNQIAVMQMLELLFTHGLTNSSIDEHLRYGEIVTRVSSQELFLKRRYLALGILPKSSYEMGINLALEATGITNQDSIAGLARECLMKARQMGFTPNLNSANLAIRLARITPCRAQIEWFKVYCDNSEDQMGYYDAFKLGGASKRNFKVNFNRMKLGNFWDDVINMLETNQLPHDFHKREKWVNASHFYKLLLEPLDIAEYYRSGRYRTKGHYLSHGRARRYKVFDRWWRERDVIDEENNRRIRRRSKYAGLTQDSCFWARVEEASELVESAARESDFGKLNQVLVKIENFELYAKKLVYCKEASEDVVAKNSSYSLWLEELRELKSSLQMMMPSELPGYWVGQMVVP